MTNHPHAARIHRRIDLLLIAITIAILVLIVCSARAGDATSNRYIEEDSWWAERAAAFFPEYHFTLQPTRLGLVSGDNDGGIGAPDVITASATWTGLGVTVNSLWSNAGNWSASPVPGTGDTATFSGAGNGRITIDLGGGVTINTILFNTASVAAYTIGSGGAGAQTLTLNDSGAITVNSTVTNSQVVNANVVLGTSAAAASYSFTNDSTTNGQLLTIAGNVSSGQSNTNATKTLTLSGSGNGVISGVISGNGSGNGSNTTATVAVVKAGAGTWTLSGANTYSGSTTINSGTLNANGGANQALGATSGVTVNGGGTLLLSSSNQINNSATMTLNGGTLRLAGVSEGTATNGGAGVGALTLSAASGVTSTIDFSGASGIIQFGGIAQTNNGSLLNITNWNGSLVGGGAEQLLFSGTASSFTSIFTQSEVLFGGVAGYNTIQSTGFYEIVPVPEPSTWIGGALTVGVLGWSQRRRFARLIKRAA